MNHSPCANFITNGAKTFYISASLRLSDIVVKDLAAYSLTTVSSYLARSSNSGKNTVLSFIKVKTFPSSSAIANNTSSSSELISSKKYNLNSNLVNTFYIWNELRNSVILTN